LEGIKSTARTTASNDGLRSHRPLQHLNQENSKTNKTFAKIKDEKAVSKYFVDETIQTATHAARALFDSIGSDLSAVGVGVRYTDW
jgi:hypothetical protein